MHNTSFQSSRLSLNIAYAACQGRPGLCCLLDYLQEEHGTVVASLNSALVQMSPQTWGLWQEHGDLPAPDVTKVAR